MPTPKLSVRPLTPDRWPDLERLFGPRGACADCWCMWWHLSRAQFDAGKGDGNRRGLRRRVEAGVVPGLLAYDGKEPVGWVAVEPREVYRRLARSRTLAPVDGVPVWSITCFFVVRGWRGRGVTRVLIDAAARHARARGARAVEAYPVVLREEVADASVYTGALSTFEALGFREIARRSPRRAIVRRTLRAAAVTPARARGARARGRGRSTRRSSPRRGSAARRGR